MERKMLIEDKVVCFCITILTLLGILIVMFGIIKL
jgi:hypothetical protein